MLHFVTSYMKQNKSHKQTRESVQCGLEISFKVRLQCEGTQNLHSETVRNLIISEFVNCFEKNQQSFGH